MLLGLFTMSIPGAAAAVSGDGGSSAVSEVGGSTDIGSASSGSEFDARGVSGERQSRLSADSEGLESQQQQQGEQRELFPTQPESAPFKFGRRQWPSQQRAEDEFLSTVGRLQAAQRQLADRDRELETLRAAVSQGRAGGGDGKDGADASGEGSSAVAEAAAAILDPDSLDWELISDAMRERGPEVGLYLFAQKLSESLGKGFDARMKSVTESITGYERSTQAAVQASRLWDGAVMAADEGGQLYFPELSDPGNLQSAMAIWREITDGMPPEVAFHPRMARMAILELRAMLGDEAAAGNGNGSGSAGAQAPAVNPGSVADQAVRRAQAAAGSRGALPPGRGVQPGRREPPETEESRIRRTLMSSGQEVGALGFRR